MFYPGSFGTSFGTFGSTPFSSGYNFPYGSSYGSSAWGGNSFLPSVPTTSYGAGISSFYPRSYSSNFTPLPRSSCASCSVPSFQLPSTQFAAPVSNYVPPVTAFASTLPYSTPSYTPYVPSNNFVPYVPPTPVTAAYTPPVVPAAISYGNYATPTFGARSYGSYTPYSPFGSCSSCTPATTFSPYSAYGGGYRSLEQPFEMPTLALPAPPVAAAFPPSAVLPSPVVGLGAFPQVGSVLPPAAPNTEAPIDAAAVEGEQAQEEEDVVEGEILVPEPKNPWAPADGEEEFDLEYSRQVAARRVIGEEDE